MLNKSMILTLIFAGLCLFDLSAQTKDWAKKNKSDKFPDTAYLQAVGVGKSEDDAKIDASRNLAKIIEVSIRSEQVYSSTEVIKGNTGQSTSTVEEQSKANVSLDVQGLRIEETDYDKKKKNYYALAVLDRQIAGNALRAEIQDRDQRYKKFLQQAQKLVEQKSYYEAIEKLQVCISELRTIQRQVKKLRVILPDKEFEASISKMDDESDLTVLIDKIGRDTEYTNLDVVSGLLAYKLYTKFAESGGNASVVIGNFIYQNTKMSSQFTAYFKEKIETELGKVGAMKVIGSKDVSLYLKSHGIQFDGTAQGLAAIAGADATIIGSYWELDDNLEVKTQIISRLTGETMGSANLSFPAKLVPASISLKPDNYSQIQSDLALLADNTRNDRLKIVVWTDKGDGGVYKEKDKLLVYVKTNKDCYIRLVYHDAGGNNIQILPNSRSEKQFKILADSVYTIGGEDSRFSFEISQPFGTEIIKAFASLNPFPELNAGSVEELDNGLYLIKEDTQSIIRQFKSIPMSKSEEGFAEASVSLTTVKDIK